MVPLQLVLLDKKSCLVSGSQRLEAEPVSLNETKCKVNRRNVLVPMKS